MNLLMWRTGLVPYSSASLWIIARLQWLPRARRHICSPSKSQTECKMSCEYKSISRLFQVFISQSLCFLSLPCSRSSSCVAPLHLPFHLPSHTLQLLSATIALSPRFSLLFSFNQPSSHSAFLLLNCLHCRYHRCRKKTKKERLQWKSRSLADWQKTQQLASRRAARSEKLIVISGGCRD